MPDYPIDYIVTFAVNGLSSHAVKINLSLLIAGLLTLLLPIAIKQCAT